MNIPRIKSWCSSAPLWNTESGILTLGTLEGEILGLEKLLSFLSTELCNLAAQFLIFF